MKDDFDGTLAKVAAIGDREVEFAGYFGRDANDVNRSLEHAGLVAPSAHFDYSYFGDKWPGVLESARVIGHRYVVCPWIDERTRQQPGIWHQAAQAFNRALARPPGWRGSSLPITTTPLSSRRWTASCPTTSF